MEYEVGDCVIVNGAFDDYEGVIVWVGNRYLVRIRPGNNLLFREHQIKLATQAKVHDIRLKVSGNEFQ